MAAKFQAITSNGDTMGSKYQKVIGKFCPACNDVNECSECIGELEPDLCYSIFRVMDRQTVEWWEKNIAEMELKEHPRHPRKGAYRELSLLVTCSHCRTQETVTLINGELESTLKFAQLKSGDILHLCSEDIHCQAKLLTGKTVGEYLRGKPSKPQ